MSEPITTSYTRLARVHQLAQSSSADAVRHELGALPTDIRNHIYHGIYIEAGNPQTEDYQWGEHHACDDLPRLQRVIQKLAYRTFDALPECNRHLVEGKVRAQCGSTYTDDMSILLENMDNVFMETLDQWVQEAPQNEERARARIAIINFLQDPLAESLCLGRLNLSSLPTIFQHPEFTTRLRQLDLSNNQLTALPPEIGSLPALKYLYLSNNLLESLPPEIGSLQALQRLELSNNRLTALPPEIGSLQALQRLYLFNNLLESLPPEIGSLQALQSLELSNNRLIALPLEIGRLQALQELYLSNNRLTVLPPEIGSLQALQSLALSNNRLIALPLEIGRLQALQSLELRNNRLESLPPEIGSLRALQSLELRNNRLTALPLEIGNLRALQRLSLQNNPQLSRLPNEILHFQGTCFVDLTGAGLSHAVLERLGTATRAPGYNGPRISFSMPGGAPRAAARSIEESLAELFASAEIAPKDFPQVVGSTHSESLKSWLARLSWTQDYKSDRKKALATKILGFLEHVEADPKFREAFFSIIDGASATCGDRVALSVLHVGIAHNLATFDKRDLKGLADFLLKGPWAIDQLEVAAREKIPYLRFFDEIEVYLGYPIKLKERLGLKIDIDGMLYFSCSALTEEDLTHAAEFIKGQLASEEARYNILIQYPEWEEALMRQDGSDLRTIKDDALADGDLDGYQRALIKYTKMALEDQAGGAALT